MSEMTPREIVSELGQLHHWPEQSQTCRCHRPA
jgi:hypothetical protein